MIADDAPVGDHTSLYRRVHPDEIVWDDNDQRPRPASSVFKDVEMSVHLGDVLEDEQREPSAVLDGRPYHSLVALTAGFVRSEDQEVRRSKLPDDESHGDVIGAKPRRRRRSFARAAEFVVLRESGLDLLMRAKVEGLQS